MIWALHLTSSYFASGAPSRFLAATVTYLLLASDVRVATYLV
jgi:hypothetical protein